LGFQAFALAPVELIQELGNMNRIKVEVQQADCMDRLMGCIQEVPIRYVRDCVNRGEDPNQPVDKQKLILQMVMKQYPLSNDEIGSDDEDVEEK
jgi:hypothetical protein